MLEISKLTQKLKNTLNLNLGILCDHEYKFKNQVWRQVAPKKYALKNRDHCSKCNGDRIRNIGDKNV